LDSNHVSGAELDRLIQRRVEQLVSLRISPLQKALIDQSAIIKTLSQGAIETEATLQRLASAVERLCERNDDARSASPAPLPPRQRPSLEPYPLPPDSGFRPRIVPEEDDKRRTRKRLAGL
jgi:hypothetical protein